jgi:hypothetical protein
MEEKQKESLAWYYNAWVIFLAILIFGPLGLLLLWFRPKTKLAIKIVFSAAVLIFSIWMTYIAVDSYQNIADYYGEMSKVLE